MNDLIEKILVDWYKMVFDYYFNNVKLKIGVKDFLDKLKFMDIKIVLVISNFIFLLEVCLKNNKIYDYFDLIMIIDEVFNGKDCLDVYLLVVNKLGVNFKNCLVFEDILFVV